jgi:hypothetical protein
MWIFTKNGFFSVVCARKEEGRSSEIDKSKLMIRARSKEHLKNLIEEHQELKDHTITEMKYSDYKYRIFVDKNIWSNISRKIAEDINYGNFKDEVKKSLNDPFFNSSLGEIWSIMYEYQK